MTLTPKSPVLKPAALHWSLWSVANHNLPTRKHFWEPPGCSRHWKCAPGDVQPAFVISLLTQWGSCPQQQLGFLCPGHDVIISLYGHTIILRGSCGEAGMNFWKLWFLQSLALTWPHIPSLRKRILVQMNLGPSALDISSSSDLSVLCGTEVVWVVSPSPGAGESLEVSVPPSGLYASLLDGHAGGWTPGGAAQWGCLHPSQAWDDRTPRSTACLLISPDSPEPRSPLITASPEPPDDISAMSHLWPLCIP